MTLIDRDALIDAIKEIISNYDKRIERRSGETFFDETESIRHFETIADGYERAIESIEKQPTIDAVSVVRRKDCKHLVDLRKCSVPLGVSAMKEHIIVDEDDFCSFGERREQDNG